MGRGLFITLEGPDGSGKTTQARLLAEYLEDRGLVALTTREPGGTPVGERIRAVLLDESFREMTRETEMLLFAAARAQLVREVIEPALSRGVTVLSERYVEASVAYQGYGRGIDVETVRAVNAVATGSLEPDLTVLLDIEPGLGLVRARSASGKAGRRGRGDRMEQEALQFYARVREGFLRQARESPHRFVVVDAGAEVEVLHRVILEAVERLLAREGYLPDGAREAAPPPL